MRRLRFSLDAVRSLGPDLAHAARSLARSRAFTLVCIVSLGIGMGAFVAIATLSRAVEAPARGIDTDRLSELLVLPLGPLRAKAGVWALDKWSYPDYQALREARIGMSITGWARTFSQVGTPSPDDAAPLPRVATLYVAANYFSTFGVSLARGPGFDPSTDDARSGEPRVVLSHDFWRSRAAADPDIVGKAVTVDGIRHVVVGITPEDFRGHFHFFQAPGSLLFIPLERHPRLREVPSLRDDRTVDWLHIHGRLEPGVDFAQANQRVSAVMSGLAQRYPATNEFKAATVEPYASLGAAGRPESRRVITMLVGAAGAVLLIVCLNISGMMLVRGAARERELCIRAALGAGRRRLIQHLFLEAVLLACAGGAVSGFVLFGIPAIVAWWLGAPVPQELDLDAAGVAISAGLCLVVSVLFGLLPALRFSRLNLTLTMKEDVGGRQIRLHRIAAMVQIGIAVPFLVISGVMLDRVRTAQFGFPTDGLAAAQLPPPDGTPREAASAIRRIRDDLQQAGGVRSVAVADGMPIDFDYREFRVGRTGSTEFVTAQVTHVGENFLETIGVPLLRGRPITSEDRITDAPVAVISAALAASLFPETEALGQQVTVTLDEAQEQTFTIVGVTTDFATSQLTTERPQILLPLSESHASNTYVIARGAPDGEARLKTAFEQILRDRGVETMPGVAFPGIVTGPDLVEKSLGDLLAESTAVAFAGGIVLILAALGIVGVVGFMVSTRTREIAVRMALGSTRFRVLSLILTDVVKLVVPGVAGGLVIAAVLIRTVENVMGTPLTLGPDPLGVMEPLIYAGASTIAVAVALVAGLPAARRATTVQPMVAMRSE